MLTKSWSWRERPLNHAVHVLLLILLSLGITPGSARNQPASSLKISSASSHYPESRGTPQRGMPDPAVEGPWIGLERRAMSSLEVFWLTPAGTPEAIYGSIAWASQYGRDPESAARGFLGAHSDLFKISRPETELALERRVDSSGGIHLYYRQILAGLPVFERETALHIDPTGVISAITNNFEPHLSLDETLPLVSVDRIYGQVLEELGTTRSEIQLIFEPRKELGVYASAGRAHLAWRLVIGSYSPPGAWEAYYDARSGERLSAIRDRSYHVQGTGRVFVPNAVVATGINSLRDQNDSASAVPNEAYSIVSLPGLNGSGSLTGRYVDTRPTLNRVNRPDNDFTDLNRSNRGFEEVEAYWAIDTAQGYIRGYVSTGAGDYSIGVNVHAIPADDSFYAGFGNGQGQISFGDGGVDDAEDAEVIWHEYGHAVLDNQRTNMDQNFDGMGEGFADYQAATLSTTVSGNPSYYPTLAEWDATSYHPGNPPFLRRVDGTGHYPENRSRDPHATGTIWSAALWDIHNSIGREAADRIFYEGNFLLPFSPTLPQATQAYLQADRNMKGGGNQTTMTNVFSKRGLIGGPELSLTLTKPGGGDSWQIGQTQTITWTSQGVSGNVRIRLSRNAGVGFANIFASVPNTGSAQWTASGPASSQCKVQIVSLENQDVRYTSDGLFSIGP